MLVIRRLRLIMYTSIPFIIGLWQPRRSMIITKGIKKKRNITKKSGIKQSLNLVLLSLSLI